MTETLFSVRFSSTGTRGRTRTGLRVRTMARGLSPRPERRHAHPVPPVTRTRLQARVRPSDLVGCEGAGLSCPAKVAHGGIEGSCEAGGRPRATSNPSPPTLRRQPVHRRPPQAIDARSKPFTLSESTRSTGPSRRREPCALSASRSWTPSRLDRGVASLRALPIQGGPQAGPGAGRVERVALSRVTGHLSLVACGVDRQAADVFRNTTSAPLTSAPRLRR